MWKPPPRQLDHRPRHVHVWRVDLDISAAGQHQLMQVLDAEEQARAARFRTARLRRHFIAARGALREVLSRYLGTAPERLAFDYGPQGKPSLAAQTGGERLYFNVSHSYGMALIAVTQDTEVGIDIEYLHRTVGGPEIVERFFSPQEVAVFRALPAEVQPHAFLYGWTRKEAFIKARGEGLTLPLDQFSVSLRPGEPARLLEVQWDPDEVTRWTLHHLDPGPDYVAALALQGVPHSVEQWHWELAE